MIKGGGACLLWEKIIAHASKRMITVCDETKIVEQLGAFPLPVEVVQFAWKQTERMVADALARHRIKNAVIARRMRDGQPVVTDSGNFILDCRCGAIPTPGKLEIELNRIPGVVENGLFTRESQGHGGGTPRRQRPMSQCAKRSKTYILTSVHLTSASCDRRRDLPPCTSWHSQWH